MSAVWRVTARDLRGGATAGRQIGVRPFSSARIAAVLAVSGTERVNACGAEVRPSVAGHTVMKQEPGAARVGKTGTATGQLVAVGQMVTHDY
jgi:hypothetical protein